MVKSFYTNYSYKKHIQRAKKAMIQKSKGKVPYSCIIAFFIFSRKEAIFLNETTIGIDAITLVVCGRGLKDLFEKVEKRNKDGHLYLSVDVSKTIGLYNVVIILPTVSSSSNLKNFSSLKFNELKDTLKIIEQDLEEILGLTNLERLVVKKVEVNANKRISAKVNVDIVTEFVSRALLETEVQQIEHVHGIISEGKTIKTKIIDGIKTARDKTGRFCCKFYRKDRQLGLEGQIEPTLRLELVYNSRGISQALGLKRKQDIAITDVLTVTAMCKLFQRYIDDVKSSIMPPIRLFLDDAVNLIVNDLKAGNGAYKTFLRRYDLIRYDFRIYKVAMKRFCKIIGNTKQSAIVQSSRVKKKAINEGIMVNEGTVKQLEEFFKEIKKQEN